MESDIILTDVSFAYRRQPVLTQVTLTISRGEFASIVGPNGGGKTTLLKLILGLLRPDSGRVRVLGIAPEQARDRIGYMPQYAHLDMNFPATVRDVVLMGRMGKGRFWFSAADRDRAQAAIDRVNLSAYGHTPISELSGGQKQRVLIARALCVEPDILLLDEPTANVDHETEENLFSLLRKLNDVMTILLVSHDLGFVSKYVKSVICVNQRVVIHPTSMVEGALIQDIYNGDLKMVRHDHRCSEGGHCND